MGNKNIAPILVIDDSKDTRRLLRLLLEKEGYEVIEAENGEEGLNAVEERKPDLILLDLQMPDMSGITVCKIIRDTPGNDSIYILMLTASTSKEIEGLDMGADDYVIKPFEKESLMARIRNGLRCSERRTNALFDSVTGLIRSDLFLQHYLPVELSRAKRYRSNLSIVILEVIDSEADSHINIELEQQVVERIAKLFDLRKGDLAILRKGMVFFLLLPVTSAKQAVIVADRMREKIGQMEFIDGIRVSSKYSIIDLNYSKNPLHEAERFLEVARSNEIYVNGKLWTNIG